MKLLIVQRIYSGYREFLFNSLAKQFDLKLFHGKNKSGIEQIQSSYSVPISVIKYGKGENHVYLRTIKKMISLSPDVIIHEFGIGILSVWPMLFVSKILRIPFIFWGHCYNKNKGFHPEKRQADKIRLFLLRRSDAILVYTKENGDLFKDHINPEKIFIAQNTLDINRLVAIRDDLIKNEVGITHDRFELTFVGRLLQDKGVELLIDLYLKLPLELKGNCVINIVGNGEMMPFLKERVHSLGLDQSFIFHGAIHDDYILGEILLRSKLLINPGYLGLSVVHAFCFDCPVVSFEQGVNGPYHSPEVAYVQNMKTGYLAKTGSLGDMARFLKDFYTNISLQEEMKKSIRQFVNVNLSNSAMQQGFLDAIKYVER